MNKALLKDTPHSDKRDGPRRRIVALGLVVTDENHGGLDCTIRDISDHGARIGFVRSVVLAQRFWLMDVRTRMAHEAEVAWRNDLEAGLIFRSSFALSQISDPGLAFLKRIWLKHAMR